MPLQIQRRSFTDSYVEFQAQAQNLYQRVEEFRGLITTRTITVDELYRLVDTINTVVSRLNGIVGLAGLRDFVMAQTNNGVDLAVEVPLTRTAVFNLRNAAVALVPQNAGFELAYTRQADGSRVPRQFTTAATNPLIALCDAALNAMV